MTVATTRVTISIRPKSYESIIKKQKRSLAGGFDLEMEKHYVPTETSNQRIVLVSTEGTECTDRNVQPSVLVGTERRCTDVAETKKGIRSTEY